MWTPQFRSIRGIAAVAVTLALAVLLTPIARGQQHSPARRILDRTNQDRAAQGLPALRWSDALAAAAEAHLRWMERENELSHQYPGEAPLMERAARAGAHFRSIAENIALGPNADAIERGWMHSTPHRRNILDPKMDAVGVAVDRVGGTLYAVEDFAQTVQSLNPRQVEGRVRALLRAQGITAFEPGAEAQQACRMTGGMPHDRRPRLLVRFQTSDLSQLPSQVVQQIRSGGFTRAAVGACAPEGGQPDFTSYRVAILFY
jgi:uncharacterized protein YkwD